MAKCQESRHAAAAALEGCLARNGARGAVGRAAPSVPMNYLDNMTRTDVDFPKLWLLAAMGAADVGKTAGFPGGVR